MKRPSSEIASCDAPVSPDSSDGMHCAIVEAPRRWVDDVGVILFEAGATGLEERDMAGRVALLAYVEDAASAERLLHAAEPALSRLREIAGAHPIEARATVVAGHDWQTAWTRSLRPERLTDRFTVVPTREVPGEEFDDTHILLEPTLAFGFGEHSTTRLAARAVERYVTARPRGSVLDVGTGSGVLAIVAARCGAGRVLGIDADPAAVEAARRNATRNAASACIFTTESVGELEQAFDLVVANLDRNTLVQLAPRLSARASRAGRLLLTGLLRDQSAEVRDRFCELGWTEVDEFVEDDWVLIDLDHGSK